MVKMVENFLPEFELWLRATDRLAAGNPSQYGLGCAIKSIKSAWTLSTGHIPNLVADIFLYLYVWPDR